MDLLKIILRVLLGVYFISLGGSQAVWLLGDSSTAAAALGPLKFYLLTAIAMTLLVGGLLLVIGVFSTYAAIAMAVAILAQFIHVYMANPNPVGHDLINLIKQPIYIFGLLVISYFESQRIANKA